MVEAHRDRMRRCWRKGSQGDALYDVLCAIGFNFCWLLQAIFGMGPQRICLLFAALQYWPATRSNALSSALPRHAELQGVSSE